MERRIEIGQRVSVVIPAYKAESSIKSLLVGVAKHLPLNRVFVVDDGSPDQTSRIALAAGAQVLRHSVNRGKGAALQSGLNAAFADSATQACITMDADGQHQPEYIPDFLDAFERNSAELVIGARRFDPLVMPVMRVLSNRLTSALVGAKLGQPVQDSQCGYRLMSREAFSLLSFDNTGFAMESEMLLKAGRAGMRMNWIPISTVYGAEKSHIHAFRDTLAFIKVWLKY